MQIMDFAKLLSDGQEHWVTVVKAIKKVRLVHCMHRKPCHITVVTRL